MISGLLSLLAVVLGWFGFGKPSDANAAERASGVSQGTAEQKSTDQGKVLEDVAKADAAANTVAADNAAGLPVTGTDGFRRD